MRIKGLVAAMAFLLAGSMVSAGGLEPGLEPGSASGAIEVGGYSDVIYTKMDTSPEGTFILGHFCLDITAEISDDVLVAAELEWARAVPNALIGNTYPNANVASASEVDGEMVCAYVDYTITEPVTLRAGKFLVPINVYNTRLVPADIAKLPGAPFMNLYLIPSKWAETGIQVHGDIDTGTEAGLSYAVYFVNGLESSDILLSDGTIYPAEKAYIHWMKNNDVEWNDSDKALGGRLGITTPVGFEIGLSGYKGAYTDDGVNDLTLIGLDACYAYEAFEVRGEYVKANQDGCSVEDQDGFYLQGAYKFLDKYETVLRYDEIDVYGTSTERFTLGGNYAITNDLTFRLSYEWCSEIQDGLIGQLAVRF